jgi:hypothetical protein
MLWSRSRASTALRTSKSKNFITKVTKRCQSKGSFIQSSADIIFLWVGGGEDNTEWKEKKGDNVKQQGKRKK